MQTKYDIIAVGGGFAGTAAAIASARMGKSVLLIEKYNCLGGAASFDLVNPFMKYWIYDKDGQRVYLSRGIFEQILDRLDELGAIDEKRVCFNEEYLKIVLNRMCIEAGVDLLFQSYVVGAEAADRQVSSVSVSNVSGITKYYADYFIDATGDANLCHICGFPYRLGREPDNATQPMTLSFRMSNVNRDLFEKTKDQINPLYKQYQSQGKIKNPREDVLIFYTMNRDTLHFNTTRIIKLDPTDARQLTRAEIEVREQVIEMVDFLKNNFEAFADAILCSTGMQIGVRESRMIIGEKTLTETDLINCVRSPEGIAACSYKIDIHSPDGPGTKIIKFAPDEYYTIPYGCLVPKNSKNLICAGRCISATHEAQSSLRIMPTCCSMGEAAGVAAAVALDKKSQFCTLDPGLVRDVLKQNGMVVD